METVQPWIGPGLTAVALVAGFVYFRAGRTKKHLDWIELSNTPIITRHAAGKLADLDVVYDGVPVKDPRLVLVRVFNSGNREVLANDYVIAPTVAFPRAKRLVGADVVRESMQDVALSTPMLIDPERKGVEIAPELMNPGDWFDLQFVVDGPAGAADFRVRFAGQTRPPRRRTETVEGRRINRLAALGIAGLTLVVVVATGSLDDDRSIADPFVIFAFALAGLIAAIVPETVDHLTSRFVQLRREHQRD